MKSIINWIISISYFGLVLYFYKNYDFLKNFYELIFLFTKSQSISKIIFTTILILIPTGILLFLINHRWKHKNE